MKRYAIVRNADSRRQIDAYLPLNYKVIYETVDSKYVPPRSSRPLFVIAGEDSHGWTLDAYVIPRCHSGLIGVEEIDLSHPIMKQIPLEATNLEGAERILSDALMRIEDSARSLARQRRSEPTYADPDGMPDGHIDSLADIAHDALDAAGMASSRKPHVHVDQDRYLDVIDEVGGEALLEDVARFFDVSESTARRKLDGLVAQGKLVVSDRCYSLSDATINDPERGSG